MILLSGYFGASFIIENVEDYSQYGLDDPICSIHIETAEESYGVEFRDLPVLTVHSLYYLRNMPLPTGQYRIIWNHISKANWHNGTLL